MELWRALGTLAEPPAPEHERLWQLLGLLDDLPPGVGVPGSDAYAELFLFRLYPYASVYLGPEGKLGGEARDRVAGFYRAIEAEPAHSGDSGPEPDHLASLLGLYAELPAESSGGHVKKALLWEHLLPWLPLYLEKLHRLPERAVHPAYRAWGALLAESLEQDAKDAGVPKSVPAHFRDAPGLADPRDEGAEPFLDSLLAPVRAGFVLVRDDLRRCATDLGLGIRTGERRYLLEALLGQDAGRVCGWLAEEAGAWAEEWGQREWLGPVGSFWAGRCRGSVGLLGVLAREGC